MASRCGHGDRPGRGQPAGEPRRRRWRPRFRPSRRRSSPKTLSSRLCGKTTSGSKNYADSCGRKQRYRWHDGNEQSRHRSMLARVPRRRHRRSVTSTGPAVTGDGRPGHIRASEKLSGPSDLNDQISGEDAMKLSNKEIRELMVREGVTYTSWPVPIARDRSQ